MAWIMQGNRPVETDSNPTPSEPFVGDSPYTFWRTDPNIVDGRPYQYLMQKDVPSEPFVGDSPYIFWRILPNANNGRPYQGLMIGVPALATRTEEIVPLTYMQEKKRFFMMLLSPPEDTDYVYVVDENNYATLVLYTGHRTTIKVPKKIDGYRVKHIASTCFNYNTNITSITIPEGIETIE